MTLGNSIYRVLVQMVDGLWVYDDAKFGVREQPLVFGMDLIQSMIEQVEGVEERLNLVFRPFFSGSGCPRVCSAETEGFVYRWEEKKLQGWFSPSLRNYFPEPPPEIYLQLLPVG